MDVTYDLGDSTTVATITILNTTTTTPPNGTVAGTQTVRYTGGSGLYTGTSGTGPTLATGAVDLLTFNLYVHATVGDYGYTAGGSYAFITLNTSDLHIEFLGLTPGASVGQRLAGGTVTPLGASGIFRVTGSVHCFKACNNIAPQSVTTPIRPDTFTAPLPRLTGAVSQPHAVYGTAEDVNFQVQVPGNAGIPITGTTFLVGREVARTAVPEPATLPLIAMALGGLGLAGTAWRRRPRR